MLKIKPGTDQVLELPGVTDREKAAQESATVTVTIRERDDGPEIEGMAWPATADHVGGGDYELRLVKELQFTAAHKELIRRFNPQRGTTEYGGPLEVVVVYTLPDGTTRTETSDAVAMD